MLIKWYEEIGLNSKSTLRDVSFYLKGSFTAEITSFTHRSISIFNSSGVLTGLVIAIVFYGSNLIQVAPGLMEGKNVIKYEVTGLFINSVFSSIIPIPTELATSLLLLSKVNIIVVFILLDTGSIVGGYVALLWASSIIVSYKES